MKRAVMGLLILGGLFSTGCLATKGAVPLVPQLQQDSKTLWIYLETNKSGADGVYRCFDAQNGPTCMKASLQR